MDCMSIMYQCRLYTANYGNEMLSDAEHWQQHKSMLQQNDTKNSDYVDNYMYYAI